MSAHLAHVAEAQVEVMHQRGVGGVVPHGQAMAAGHRCGGDQVLPRGHPATVGHHGVITLTGIIVVVGQHYRGVHNSLENMASRHK